jgi:hypothetical protein
MGKKKVGAFSSNLYSLNVRNAVDQRIHNVLVHKGYDKNLKIFFSTEAVVVSRT